MHILLINIFQTLIRYKIFQVRQNYFQQNYRHENWQRILIAMMFVIVANPGISRAETNPLTSPRSSYIHSSYKITVNSNQDDGINRDNFVTLREAIAIINGTLETSNLTASELNQVEQLQVNQASRIEFNLPATQTIIELREILPPISTPNVIIDGTTQPGYDGRTSVIGAIPNVEGSIAKPVVSITPANNTEIFRGLTITADNVTIRGLNLYGFTSRHHVTATTPPANIFIASPATNFPSRPGGENQQVSANKIPNQLSNQIPTNIIIENNWLGITKDEKMPETTSAFGVSVFNGDKTIIRNNRISYHDGSAIITGMNAEGTKIIGNMIIGNGLAGMPDAIRLEGRVRRTEILGNLMCGNDGSGVFLFKPEGYVEIANNQIKHNGRRLRRAAVYLMGSNHQVKNNEISYQSGPGVVVTAFPNAGSFLNGAAVGNAIASNIFANLEGLSIDLNTRGHVDVQDFQRGDGKNPRRTSENRRLDTGNGAINAPEFISKEFLQTNNQVLVKGKTEPNSQVQLYQIRHNALNQIITVLEADAKGEFSANIKGLNTGDIISAIATHKDFGTSEPASYAVIRNLDDINTKPVQSVISSLNENPTAPITPTSTPTCLTKVEPPEPPKPPEKPPETPPEPIRLRVPTNIHYALDKDFISKESGKVLDQIAAVLKQYPTFIIELQGHTDSRASDAYNQDLARRRARNARNYLIKQGIAPERMTIRSFGERKLKTPGRDRVEHARNRRVEVIFFDTRGVDIILEEQERDLQIEGSR